MPAIGTELLVLLALLALNGLLAMAELAVVSARRTRLQQRAEAGDAGAAAALALSSDPSRFLSTIQIGITGVGILAGAFGGATVAKELDRLFGAVPVLADHRELLSFGLVVIGITYLSLLFGELVPKQVALANPEQVAAVLARPMLLLSRLAAPLVWLLSGSSAMLLSLLRVRPRPQDDVSVDDIRVLLERGGAVDPAERALMLRALGLDKRRVADIMTPWPQAVWLDADAPFDENARRIAMRTPPCVPVCAGDRETVLGTVSIADLWTCMITGGSVDLRRLPLAPPVYVLERQSALRLLEVFQTQQAELAVVVDEHGRTVGVATPGDLAEVLLGEASRLRRRWKHPPTRCPDGSWLLDGLMPVGDVAAQLAIAEHPQGSQGGYRSLGGLVFARVGKVPTRGDRIEWGGWQFEVVAMDGKRVDQVRATPAANEPTARPGESQAPGAAPAC